MESALDDDQDPTSPSHDLTSQSPSRKTNDDGSEGGSLHTTGSYDASFKTAAEGVLSTSSDGLADSNELQDDQDDINMTETSQQTGPFTFDDKTTITTETSQQAGPFVIDYKTIDDVVTETNRKAGPYTDVTTTDMMKTTSEEGSHVGDGTNAETSQRTGPRGAVTTPLDTPNMTKTTSLEGSHVTTGTHSPRSSDSSPISHDSSQSLQPKDLTATEGFKNPKVDQKLLTDLQIKAAEDAIKNLPGFEQTDKRFTRSKTAKIKEKAASFRSALMSPLYAVGRLARRGSSKKSKTDDEQDKTIALEAPSPLIVFENDEQGKTFDAGVTPVTKPKRRFFNPADMPPETNDSHSTEVTSNVTIRDPSHTQSPISTVTGNSTRGGTTTTPGGNSTVTQPPDTNQADGCVAVEFPPGVVVVPPRVLLPVTVGIGDWV